MNETRPTNQKSAIHETLGTLSEFCEHLASRCQECAGADTEQGNEVFQKKFGELLDGLQLISEGLFTVKQITPFPLPPELAIVEADQLSILQDLLAARRDGNREFSRELLSTHLRANLEEMRAQVIPAMMKAMDAGLAPVST